MQACKKKIPLCWIVDKTPNTMLITLQCQPYLRACGDREVRTAFLSQISCLPSLWPAGFVFRCVTYGKVWQFPAGLPDSIHQWTCSRLKVRQRTKFSPWKCFSSSTDLSIIMSTVIFLIDENEVIKSMGRHNCPSSPNIKYLTLKLILFQDINRNYVHFLIYIYIYICLSSSFVK